MMSVSQFLPDHNESSKRDFSHETFLKNLKDLTVFQPNYALINNTLYSESLKPILSIHVFIIFSDQVSTHMNIFTQISPYDLADSQIAIRCQCWPETC